MRAQVVARNDGAEVILQGPFTIKMGPGATVERVFTQALPPNFTGTFELVAQAFTPVGLVEDSVVYTVR